MFLPKPILFALNTLQLTIVFSEITKYQIRLLSRWCQWLLIISRRCNQSGPSGIGARAIHALLNKASQRILFIILVLPQHFHHIRVLIINILLNHLHLLNYSILFHLLLNPPQQPLSQLILHRLRLLDHINLLQLILLLLDLNQLIHSCFELIKQILLLFNILRLLLQLLSDFIGSNFLVGVVHCDAEHLGRGLALKLRFLLDYLYLSQRRESLLKLIFKDVALEFLCNFELLILSYSLEIVLHKLIIVIQFF